MGSGIGKDKSSIDDLAVLGGSPAFSEPLHVGRPNLPPLERFTELVGQIFERGWLTNSGPVVQEFERRLAERIGVRHCITTTNATVALELVIRGCDLSGEVIVPSFTFVATAHAVQWLGLTPVFADVGPDHNLDPDAVAALINERTSAILGVHLWGRPCDVDGLTDVARRHGLTLLFDAAHALGCTLRGRNVGTFGRAEVFSFHATKYVNSAEGGAVTTNDDILAERIRLMRNFGFVNYDQVIYLGTNAKMNELSAAMGLASLEQIDEIREVNRLNHVAYLREMSDIRGLRFLEFSATDQSNHQYVVAEVDPSVMNLERDEIVSLLMAENILVRRYFHPGCHRMEPYRTLYPSAGVRLGRTEHLTDRIMVFPTGRAVTPDSIQRIAQCIRLAVEGSSRLRGQIDTSALNQLPRG